MINKKVISDIVSKYSLGNNIEKVKWSITDEKFHINNLFISANIYIMQFMFKKRHNIKEVEEGKFLEPKFDKKGLCLYTKYQIWEDDFSDKWNKKNPVPFNSEHFEIDNTDQTEAILNVLKYSGIVIRDPQIINSAQQMAAAEDQNEKS